MSDQPFQIRKNKYTWTAKEFDDWCKGQVQELGNVGVKSNTAGVTRLLINRVLIPNQINLSNLIVPTNAKVKLQKIQVQRCKRKQMF